MIEEDSFTPFHVMLDGDALAMIWTTDGLSAGVDWFCGGSGMPADAPDEFCLGALTDDAVLCDASAADHTEVTRTVAEARAAGEELVNAAIVEHANAHELADDASVTGDVATCEAAVVVDAHDRRRARPRPTASSTARAGSASTVLDAHRRRRRDEHRLRATGVRLNNHSGIESASDSSVRAITWGLAGSSVHVASAAR